TPSASKGEPTEHPQAGRSRWQAVRSDGCQGVPGYGPVSGLLALGVGERHGPRNPVKISGSQSRAGDILRRNVTDTSVRTAQHTLRLEDSANVRSRLADSEQA